MCRCVTVWHSANSVREYEDDDGDSDEEAESGESDPGAIASSA